MVALVALAACAPAAGNGASQNTTAAGRRPTGDRPSGTPDAGSTDPDCTKATKAAIVATASGSGDTYSFSPSKLTIQRGGFLAISNKSGAVHVLVSTPDAGIVTSILDKKERQVIQFPRTGRFTVHSADASHRAVLRVTVFGDSGCGAPKPTLTITGTAAGHYSFTPAALTVAATANFTVVNESNAAQTAICTPNPGGNGDNSKLDQGETQLLAIDKPGRYQCSSLQHSNAKVTITVNGT
jgi:plastocyanin